MQKQLKIYVAGKVSPDSVFGTHDWRGKFCNELGQKSGYKIINLDPTKRKEEDFAGDENSAMAIVGRDCFLIKNADLVIVNLTDDISVGGSQEMLIAKYYRKPLIGIASKGGKFNKIEKNIRGHVYKNYIHPFVAVPCDAVVEDIAGAAECVKKFFANAPPAIKDIFVIDMAREYYETTYRQKDEYLEV